jgi:hypothetical protein
MALWQIELRFAAREASMATTDAANVRGHVEQIRVALRGVANITRSIGEPNRAAKHRGRVRVLPARDPGCAPGHRGGAALGRSDPGDQLGPRSPRVGDRGGAALAPLAGRGLRSPSRPSTSASADQAPRDGWEVCDAASNRDRGVPNREGPDWPAPVSLQLERAVHEFPRLGS